MHINGNFPSLASCENHSSKILEKIRTKLKEILNAEDFCIVTTGSFARSEASLESDLDWFIVHQFKPNEDILLKVDEQIKQLVSKEFGSTGTFGESVLVDDLLINFGGLYDDNASFTRRMLYLLESKWLYNENMFISVKRKLLEIYIKENIPDKKLNKFFLNDIIRYYRTICTDFEYKVSEAGKSWGVRNIKLRFSRKLLYISGVMVVAETCNLKRDEKINKTMELLQYSPIERISQICKSDLGDLLKYYNCFLEAISDSQIRGNLDSVKKECRDSHEQFYKLKQLSQLFSEELHKHLVNRFEPGHAIHHSLIL